MLYCVRKDEIDPKDLGLGKQQEVAEEGEEEAEKVAGEAGEPMEAD